MDLFYIARMEERESLNKSILHSSFFTPLLSSRKTIQRSPTLVPPSQQRLHKSQFLQKLGCQKLYWDPARLSSMVNKHVSGDRAPPAPRHPLHPARPSPRLPCLFLSHQPTAAYRPCSCLFRSSAVNGVVAGVSALSQKQQQKQQAKIRSLNQLMNNQPKKAQQQKLAKKMNMLPQYG